MKFLSFLILSIFLILISPLLVLSTEGWLMLWMMIEMGSVGFILLMKSMEVSVIYFLTQTFGSTMILFHLVQWKENLQFSFSMSSTILAIGLALKMGLIPFHQWFLNVGSKIKKSALLILVTIQKITPLFLFKLFMKMFFSSFVAFLSVFLGVFFQMNTYSLKKLLLYSSISNLGWMIFLASFQMLFLSLYFFIYFLILSGLIPFLKMDSLIVPISFMSLAGIPPLLGFFMKLIALKTFGKWSEIWSVILLILSVINVFIYFRVFTPKSMKSPSKVFHTLPMQFEKLSIFLHFGISFFFLLL